MIYSSLPLHLSHRKPQHGRNRCTSPRNRSFLAEDQASLTPSFSASSPWRQKMRIGKNFYNICMTFLITLSTSGPLYASTKFSGIFPDRKISKTTSNKFNAGKFSGKGLAREGGFSDGGGCVVSANNKALLLDMVYTDTLLSTQVRGDQLEVSQAMKNIGIFPVSISHLRSLQLARELVKKWDGSGDIWIQYLQDTLNHLHLLPYHGIPYRILKTTRELCTPQKNSNSDARPVVIFDKENGLLVSVLDFNRMDLYSQAGLWIHEAFRAIQVLNQEPISNEIIFKMTSEILADRKLKVQLQEQFPLVGSLNKDQSQNEIFRLRSEKLCREYLSHRVLSDLRNKFCESSKRSNFKVEELAEIHDALLPMKYHLQVKSAQQNSLNANDQALLRHLYETLVFIAELIRGKAQAGMDQLENSPELKILLGAMQRMNKNIFEEYGLSLLEKVAVRGYAPELTQESNSQIRTAIKAIRAVWDERENAGYVTSR